MTKRRTLNALHESLAQCDRCTLCVGRRDNDITHGAGRVDAKLFLVADTPATFEGDCGDVVTDLLADFDLRRSRVYTCTVVRCPPKPGHVPDSEELKTCSVFLHKELAIVKPAVVVTFGSTALHAVVQVLSVSSARGMVYTHKKLPYKVVPTYHPAVVFKNAPMRAVLRHDVGVAVQEVLRVQAQALP